MTLKPWSTYFSKSLIFELEDRNVTELRVFMLSCSANILKVRLNCLGVFEKTTVFSFPNHFPPLVFTSSIKERPLLTSGIIKNLFKKGSIVSYLINPNRVVFRGVGKWM